MKKLIKIVALLLFLIAAASVYYWSQNSGEETPVQAIEEIRKENFVQYIIHEEFDDSGGFIYFLREMNSDSPNPSVEYVKKTRNGNWKWVYGGGHSGGQFSLVDAYTENDVQLSYQYLAVVEEKRFRIPHPVIFGGISDPEISRIVVRDYETGLERQVNIIQVNDMFRFYYANLTKSQGLKFDLIAFNGKNEVVYEGTMDEAINASGSAGTGQ